MGELRGSSSLGSEVIYKGVVIWVFVFLWCIILLCNLTQGPLFSVCVSFSQDGLPCKGFWEIQFGSATQSCPTLCNPMDCSTSGLPVHHQLLELAQLLSIELVMASNHLILCHPLLLLPSIFPSIRVFSS